METRDANVWAVNIAHAVTDTKRCNNVYGIWCWGRSA